MSEQDCATELLDELCLVVVNKDASWMELTSTLAVALAAVLSAIAVGVSIYIARKSNKQVSDIAEEAENREQRAFSTTCKTDFRDQAKQLLISANLIDALLNPMVSNAFTGETGSSGMILQDRLAQLQAETDMVKSCNFDTAQLPKKLLQDLFEAAGWVYADALNLAIVTHGSHEYRDFPPGDLNNVESAVEFLLEMSSQYFEPRLLVESWQGNEAENTALGEAYERRKKLLEERHALFHRRHSIVEVAADSLRFVSIRQFQDLVDQVLLSWDQR